MLIDFIVGARPNFMKLSPIYLEYQKAFKKSFKIRIVHSGQHSEYLMSNIFLKELNIKKIDYFIKCKKSNHYEELNSIMNGYQKILNKSKPRLIVVFGDVNSTMAISIVAKKNNIKLCHVEAGLRSYDMSMPEEINRIVTDTLSDYFFTTSEHANNNLIKSGILKKRIFFVGNTMIDNLKNNINKALMPNFFYSKNLTINEYLLLTLHRPSNTNDISVLKNILESISKSVKSKKIVFIMHPRYIKKIPKFYFKKYNNVVFSKPIGYLNFIALLKNSLGVITDSGGITEESTFLKKPCITMRFNTERPETILEGTNVLIGNDYKLLQKYINKIINKKWKNSKIPNKWDGKTSIRILNILKKIVTYEK